MSLIEKAVERLDQLKRAGVTPPPDVGAVAAEAPRNVPAAPQPAAAAPAVQPQSAPVVDADMANRASAQSKSITIDLARLGAMGMVSPLNTRSMIAEEYRVIKRPLLRNAAEPTSGAHRNLIMVTSSVPGEGKSFSSINLAISMAMELDRTVLLVDADVSRPSVLNHLGLPPAPGLMDVLLLTDRSVDLPDVMLRTNIEKLSILPAGMPHQRATEFLASDAMVKLVDELATRYPDRIIVFDSPPLLMTTEARVLANHMGQVVIVVEAGRTTQSMVRQALATIEQCPLRMMLLNKTRDIGPGGYYGYYSPYGYGSQEREH
ncbi:MAG: XrtA-associated tyrosine autokinase [Rhodocyclaceae bacterium]